MIKRNINGFAVQILVATSLVFALALAACGGGGGGGGGTSATPLPTAAVTITSTNAPQVAGAGFDTGKSGGGLPVGVQTSVSAPINHPPLTNIQTLAQIAQKSEQSISSPKSPPAMVAGVLPNSPNTTCPGGGSLTVSVIDATSGSASYNNCSDGAGETLNGTISFSNIVADPSTVSFNATFSLSVTTTSSQPVNTMTVSGDMTVSASMTTFAMTISGSNLTMRNTNASFGDFALLNYSVTIDGITGYATAMTFTYSSTVVGGTARFVMTTPFTYTNLHIFPNSGVATITGANLTVLRVTVLGDEFAAADQQVKLELSTDDGVSYSVLANKTWAEISNYL